MPLDPRIPLGVNLPSIMSPQEAMAEQAKQKLVQQQAQLGQLKLQDAEEERAAAEVVRQALESSIDKKTGNINREIFLPQLAKNPRAAEKLPGYLDYFARIDESSKRSKAAYDAAEQADEEHIADIGDTALAYIENGLPLASAVEVIKAGMAQAVHNGRITQEEMTKKLLEMNPEDPASVTQFAKGMRLKAEKYRKTATTDGKAVAVDTVDESGNPVRKFVEGKIGESYPLAPKASGSAPNVGSFEDYVLRRFGQNPTAKDITQARKDYMQADDKATGFAAGDVTKLSPAGLDMAALMYKKTGVMPALGMGDRTTRQAIINRAAELNADQMAKIETGVGDIAANKAGYRASSDTLTKLTQQRAAIGAFEQTAQKNIDIFLSIAGKVVDTGSPVVNRPLRSLSASLLGSPDQAAYEAARQVAINEIAKIATNPNLTGQLTDTARKEVEAFNPNSATLKQTVAVMRVLKRDMNNRITALDKEISDTKKSLTTGAPAVKRYNPATGKLE